VARRLFGLEIKAPISEGEGGVFVYEDSIRRFNFCCAWSLLIFIFCTPALAEIKAFIKEYTYPSRDFDSRISSRTIGIEQVKRLLLEEL